MLDAAAESVALNSFGAAAAVLHSKKKATLIAAATAAAAAANAVGVPSSAVPVAAVAVPASPAMVVPPTSASPVSAAHTTPLPAADGVPHTPPPALKHVHHHRSTSYPLRAAPSMGGGLFNGPQPDEARLNALLESGTITSTLYIEGLPLDATEREISHIFRPFDGFVSLRLRPTTSKRDPSVSFVLCFVEFDSPQRAAAALDARQGYQLSLEDRTLKITFANSARSGAPSTPKN